MKFIELHRRDGSIAGRALVDDDDFERFGHLPWSLHWRGYAVRSFDGKQRLMHRVVLGLPPGRAAGEVDHKNGDPLDNRKENLRVVTSAQQKHNQVRGAASGYRNVYRMPGHLTKPWKAEVKLNGRGHYLGAFATPEEAALAASDFRREHMPYSNESRPGHRPTEETV